MAYSQFVEMYARTIKRNPEELLKESPLSFPMSTNERGDALVSFFQRVLKFNVKGLRVLDVGCAYGGLSLAMARAGANVTGVDVSAQFVAYAQVNAEGDAPIDFHVVDASSVGMRRLFERGSFDLILLNDVLEHIYDTTSLAINLDYLLNDTGIVYFKVPNGHSPRWVLSEGHRKIFGLPVLDPDCWFYLYPKRASIFYRPLPFFQAIFGHYGFSQTLFVDEEQVLRRFTAGKLRRQIKEIYATYKDARDLDPTVKRMLAHGINRFRDEFVMDQESQSDEYVRYKYGSYFYTGFAGRPGASLVAQTNVLEIPGIGRLAARE